MADEDPPDKIYADLPNTLPLASKLSSGNHFLVKFKKILTKIWVKLINFCEWYFIVNLALRFLWWLTSDEEIAGNSSLLENHFVPDPMPNFTLPLHIYLTRDWNISATNDPEIRIEDIIRYDGSHFLSIMAKSLSIKL